ncbi:hypothetical protein GCM10011365_21170 [Marinicella pacifica]|uniref:Uncharacterized protein n=1 Tax=Marinicella pacifica TaxID=1171543 RepID=A0A917CX22_9GAMM|nr:hypothetical protein [Marinicella pacifica]GGF99672.1 hypothetical protein GCM10011365_21170 [Marinicella pacifica]
MIQSSIKTFNPFIFVGLMVLGLTGISSGRAGVATITQTINLQPGWNAVYVEIEPQNNDIETIFSGVPVASVWRWIPEKLGSDFLVNPAEGLMNLEGWFGYFPEPKPEAFLSNLYTLSANTAYLIKLEGSVAKSISLTGKPVYVKKKWRTNGFTLTGFPLVAGQEPSFGDFFANSTAHQGQPVYKLNPQGVWEAVQEPYLERMKSGEAYWFYTHGTSRYQGMINATIEQGESMEYRGAFTEMDLVLSNLSDVTNFVSLNRMGGSTLPMKFLNVDLETGEKAWPDLPVTKVYELQPGEDLVVTLAVNRLAFSEQRMEQVFSITNEQGAKVLIHAGGNTLQPLVLPTGTYQNDTLKLSSNQNSYAGLWVGTARVRAVSQAQNGGVNPLPVGNPFPVRVMMHVDATGRVKLVKNVVQMWQDGTYRVSPKDPTLFEVDEPGRYVLLTRDELIPNYSGITKRSGQSAGIRYSTVAYDFNGDDIEMNGEFQPGNQVNVSLLIDPNMPTNPFRHKFHPDHDNLDAQFLNYKQEAFQVTREMEFLFTSNNPQYPDVADPPGWGVSIMGGTFRETLTGLHKNAIFVSGDFRLTQVSSTAILNQ